MRGFTRRRWSAAAIAAVFALILSGCTVGIVTIPVGYTYADLGCPPGVDLGPGHVSARPNVYSTHWWFTRGNHVRFNITHSNSTTDLVVTFIGRSATVGSVALAGATYEYLWDGANARSRGAIDVWFAPGGDGYHPYDVIQGPFFIVVKRLGPADTPWDFDFVLAGVDASGNDVGLSCL